MRAVAKPWRCRLKLHDWEKHETPERYELCTRCDAFRDRQGFPRGSGGPGGSARATDGMGGLGL